MVCRARPGRSRAPPRRPGRIELAEHGTVVIEELDVEPVAPRDELEAPGLQRACRCAWRQPYPRRKESKTSSASASSARPSCTADRRRRRPRRPGPGRARRAPGPGASRRSSSSWIERWSVGGHRWCLLEEGVELGGGAEPVEAPLPGGPDAPVGEVEQVAHLGVRQRRIDGEQVQQLPAGARQAGEATVQRVVQLEVEEARAGLAARPAAGAGRRGRSGCRAAGRAGARSTSLRAVVATQPGSLAGSRIVSRRS